MKIPDCGGEYLNQDFYDHLKSCGIVSQWTPPHHTTNEWSKMNKTLLDIVQSMMSLTKLHISFRSFSFEKIAFTRFV